MRLVLIVLRKRFLWSKQQFWSVHSLHLEGSSHPFCAGRWRCGTWLLEHLPDFEVATLSILSGCRYMIALGGKVPLRPDIRGWANNCVMPFGYTSRSTGDDVRIQRGLVQ